MGLGQITNAGHDEMYYYYHRVHDAGKRLPARGNC
jgi:hypothetical protein